MAKLSAHGATVVAKFEVARDESEGGTRFALTSDGRVLRQWYIVDHWEGWSIYGRIKDPAKRTKAFLRAYLKAQGYTITKEL